MQTFTKEQLLGIIDRAVAQVELIPEKDYEGGTWTNGGGPGDKDFCG